MKESEFGNKTGLKPEDLHIIKRILFNNPAIKDAVIFGSRAKGTWKRFSDIDIALMGDEISHEDMINVMSALEDTSLPYMFDIIRFSTISNPDLIDHITRIGISLQSIDL